MNQVMKNAEQQRQRPTASLEAILGQLATAEWRCRAIGHRPQIARTDLKP
jgi:hypothetical protein